MRAAFDGVREPLTLGLEEELMLLDPARSRWPRSGTR